MFLSRRRFLSTSIMCAPAVLLTRAHYARDSDLSGSKGYPLIRNHNPTSRPVIVEGKSLLVSLTFPFEVNSVTGSLPVQIAPASTRGATLIEPQPLYFHPSADGRTFHTILTAPLDAVHGQGAELEIKALLPSSDKNNIESEYTVERCYYRSSSLKLSRDFSSPPQEVATRMRRDFQTMVEIYRRRTPRRWKSPFILPVTCSHRNNFGDRRIVNGEKSYRHAGLDFNAPIGTPVRAINDGVVALSGEQWTPGETICIDHGGGVFSKYMHLSERHVKEGDSVRLGETIALSGQSGGQRPGPHLHLDVVVNGSHVDPFDFLRTAGQLIAMIRG